MDGEAQSEQNEEDSKKKGHGNLFTNAPFNNFGHKMPTTFRKSSSYTCHKCLYDTGRDQVFLQDSKSYLSRT